MSGSVSSLEWLVTSDGSCNNTTDELYLPSGDTSNDLGSSNVFTCPEHYARHHYSSTTCGPPLDDPYYSGVFPPDGLSASPFSLATTTPSTGRIPPDSTKSCRCRVCGDTASGNHFGVLSCDACKSFFRRSMRAKTRYACRGSRTCTINARTRGRCQYCRLSKCLAAGMKKQANQDEEDFKSSDQLQSSSCSTPIGSPSNPSNPFQLVPHERQFNLNFGSTYGTNYSENVYTSNSSIASSTVGLSLGSTTSSSSGPSVRSTSFQLSSAPSSPVSSSVGSSPLCSPDAFLDDSDVWLQATGEYQMEECVVAQDLVRGLEACLKRMIQWSMRIPEFRNLDEETQVSLIQNSWCEQCTLQFAVCNANKLGTARDKDGRPISSPNQTLDTALRQVMREVVEVAYWLEHLGMDRTELACMRGILLFNPVSAGLTPTSRQKVESYQEHVISLMTSHASKTYGTQTRQRDAKLLYQLAPLKIISQKVVEILKEQRARGMVVISGIFDELIDL